MKNLGIFGYPKSFKNFCLQENIGFIFKLLIQIQCKVDCKCKLERVSVSDFFERFRFLLKTLRQIEQTASEDSEKDLKPLHSFIGFFYPTA